MKGDYVMAADGIEVARAYVTIIPSLEGSQKTISQELGAASDSAGKDAGNKAGSGFGNAFSSAIKGTAAIASTAIGAAVSATTALVKGTANMAAYGDEIEKTSQKVGLSASAYQEWDYILQISGTDMSKMTTGFKTLTNKLDDAKNGSKDAQAMFAALGLSMEDLNSMSREDLFEETVKGFQGLEDSTERAALANDLFGKSGQDLAPLFNTSVEDTEKLRETYAALGMQLSDSTVKASAAFQDNLTNLKGAISGVKNSIFSQALPGLNALMEGFTGLITGEKGAKDALKVGFKNMLGIIKDIVGQILSTVAELLPDAIDVISSALPEMVETGIDILVSLIDGIIQALPTLLDAVGNIIASLINKLAEGIPKLLTTLVKALPTIIKSLLANIITIVKALVAATPQITRAIIEAVVAIIDMLPDIITMIVEVLPDLINCIIQSLFQNFPMIIEAITKFVIAIAKAMPKIIIAEINAIPIIIDALADALIDCAPQLIAAIAQLVGIITQKIPSILKSLWDSIVSIFKLFFIDIPKFMLNILPNIITALGNIFTGVWNACTEFVKKVGDWFFNTEVGKFFINLATSMTMLFDEVKSFFTQLFASIVEFCAKVFDKVKTFFSDVASKVKEVFTTIFNAVKEKLTSIFDTVKDVFIKIYNAIKTPIENAKTTISTVINTMKTTISNVFNSIYTTVSDIFNRIKAAIVGPIDTAKSLVSNAINAIKNIINNAGFSLPHIKLPHFSISGSLSLTPPSVPHVSVSWYSKGYDEAQILRDATVFGMANGNLLAGGERGNEVVVGEQHLLDMISSVVNPAPIVVNVYGAEGQDEELLAQKVMEKIQEITNSKEVVYA